MSSPVMIDNKAFDYKSINMSDVARGTKMSLSAVSRVFSGDRNPRISTAIRIAAYLGITIDELLQNRLVQQVGREAKCLNHMRRA